MEQKPPARRRETPRDRGPQAPFSAAAEPPAPADSPAQPARRAAKAAPAVTFRPPSAENHPDEARAAADAAGRSPDNPSSGTPRQPSKAAPPPASSTGEPPQSPRRTTPRKARSPKAPSDPEPAAQAPDGVPIPTQPRATPAVARTAEGVRIQDAGAAVKKSARAQKATPETVTRKVTARETATPQAATPEAATPETATPETATPQPATPEPAAPGAATPRRAPKKATATRRPRITTPADPPAEPTSVSHEVTTPSTAVDASGVHHVGPEAEAVPDDDDRGGDRIDAWVTLVANPGHAAELLALAAVQSIGPRAREWAARTRRNYPHAGTTALVRLAAMQFTRAGSVGAAFGAVAGPYAAAGLVTTAAVAHAELVLHLAAAHGVDPTDPERAIDLLVVTGLHRTRDEARAALAAARQPAYDDGVTEGVWRLGRKVATWAGGWRLVRLVDRRLPGLGLFAAVLTGRAAAERTAARAIAHYRTLTHD